MADKAGESQNSQQPPPYSPGPSYNEPPPAGYPQNPSAYPHPQYQAQPPAQPIYMQPGPTMMPAQSVTIVQSVPSGAYVQNYQTSQYGTQVVVVNSLLGNSPSTVNCRSCNHQIVTRVEYAPGIRTHLTAFLLCILGCWPCACIPYCVDTCKNADHYCTNCGAYVGASRF